jgi:sulfite exporter TauE/SafE/plastocyanin domain-containing protein/copper chaperone CopZ
MNYLQEQLNKCEVQVHGMHCASCEVLIERRFKKISGVRKVRVNHATGRARIDCSRVPEIAEFDSAVRSDGYQATWWTPQTKPTATSRPNSRHYIEIGGVFLVVVAVYLLLRQFDILPKSIGVSENMSYGIVFLIGLVAAMSTCIAVTGGLLLGVAAKYNELHPGLTGAQKFRPHVYFNLGRIVSYTMLGGAVGAVGSVFTLSPRANGVLTIIASLVMILLGFQLLKLFPSLGRFSPRTPKFLAHRVHNLASSKNRFASFALGAGTFFLPCGFTQALQLYVLSQGSALQGALTMLIFSLGTLPALVSLGVLTSFARGSFQRYFLKFAGVVVILVGIFSVRNGFALTGLSASVATTAAPGSAVKSSAQEARSTAVPIVDGKQIAEMKVKGLSYSPAQFTVVKDIPVEWRIDGSGAQGCGNVITAPAIDVNAYLPPDEVKTIEFTPTQVGTIKFSCSMGMTTPGAAFNVIENSTASPEKESPEPTVSKTATQKIAMEVTQERGFYPTQLEVKKGIPVDFEVSVFTDLGGCMSTLVIPEFDVAQLLKQGPNLISFTPNETGTFLVTCPMGVPMTTLNVT